MKKISTIYFDKDQYPDVIGIINDLAELEDRRPHDSAKRLILEAGRNRIEAIKKNRNCQEDSN